MPHTIKKRGLHDAEGMMALKYSACSMMFYRTSAATDLLIKESSSVLISSTTKSFKTLSDGIGMHMGGADSSARHVLHVSFTNIPSSRFLKHLTFQAGTKLNLLRHKLIR